MATNNRQGLMYHDGSSLWLGVSASGEHTDSSVIISSGNDSAGVKVSKPTSSGRKILYLSDSEHTHTGMLTTDPSSDGLNWKTLAPNSSNFVNYVSGQDITYRRFGAVVQIIGELKPKSTSVDINSSNSISVCTIPVGYRPLRRLRFMCHGSGNNKFMLSIETTGAVYINRYGSTEGYASSITGNEWLPFSATWLTNGN